MNPMSAMMFGDGLNVSNMAFGPEPDYMGGLGTVPGMGQVEGMQGMPQGGAAAGAGINPMAAILGLSAMKQLGALDRPAPPPMSAPGSPGPAPRGQQVQLTTPQQAGHVDPKMMTSLYALLAGGGR